MDFVVLLLRFCEVSIGVLCRESRIFKALFADFCREFVTLFYQDVTIFCHAYVCMRITVQAPVFFGSLSRL